MLMATLSRACRTQRALALCAKAEQQEGEDPAVDCDGLRLARRSASTLRPRGCMPFNELLDTCGRLRSPECCPAFIKAVHPATRASATRPTRRRSMRSSPSCATPATRAHGHRLSGADRRAVARRAADQRGALADRDRSGQTARRRFWSGTARTTAAARSGWRLGESAGINRHGEGDENALHRRT